MTERGITEWVRLGLLDTSDRVGRADGNRGAQYVWPNEQKDLMVALLHHQQAVKRPIELVVIPVSVWLYWGEQWVPTRQVRRALMTSVNLFGAVRSWERARANAREVVVQLFGAGAPKASANKLIEELANRLHRGETHFDDLLPLIESLAPVPGAKVPWGPFTFDAERVLDFLRNTSMGISMLDNLRDEDLFEARDRQRDSVLHYLRDWPRLAALEYRGVSFERLSLNLLIQRSCRDLLQQLGMIGVARERGYALDSPSRATWVQPPASLLYQAVHADYRRGDRP